MSPIPFTRLLAPTLWIPALLAYDPRAREFLVGLTRLATRD